MTAYNDGIPNNYTLVTLPSEVSGEANISSLPKNQQIINRLDFCGNKRYNKKVL